MTLAAAAALLSGACAGGGDGATPPGAQAADVAINASATGAIPSIGDTRTLTAVVMDASQNTLPNAAVTWQTSNAGVAALSQTTGASTTITAAGNGTATITARSGTISRNFNVEVAQRFAALVLSPLAFDLNVNATRQLAATARDARANDITGVGGVTFGSSDQSKATVSATGLVTGLSAGEASITATLTRDGVTRSALSIVTVTTGSGFPSTAAVSTTSDAFTPTEVDIARGGTVTWTFGPVTHNVNFDGTAGAPANIGNSTSTSVPRTFNSAGTFNYSCNLHSGMNGTVRVH